MTAPVYFGKFSSHRQSTISLADCNILLPSRRHGLSDRRVDLGQVFDPMGAHVPPSLRIDRWVHLALCGLEQRRQAICMFPGGRRYLHLCWTALYMDRP